MPENLCSLLQDDQTLLFVGIGNRLKSDDAVGIIICENIIPEGRRRVLIVESGIEKYVGKINLLAPDILVLVDCTDFDQAPGYFKLFSITDTLDNTIHTHTISLLRLSEFFAMPIFVLGIQPEFVGFGETISPQVLDTANRLIHMINEIA